MHIVFLIPQCWGIYICIHVSVCVCVCVYKTFGKVSTLTDLFILLCLLGPHLQHTKIPRIGFELELQLQPRPQQSRGGAASVTYTTVHSNIGSLTHWARPGIKPMFSRIPVDFVTTKPQWELLFYFLIWGFSYREVLLILWIFFMEVFL